MLKVAQGDYIVFIDGDDYVSPTYVADLVAGIKLGADIACSSFQMVAESRAQGEVWFRPVSQEPVDLSGRSQFEVVSRELAVKKLLTQEFEFSVWGKLFPRSYFEQVSFPENVYYEDALVCCQLFLQAESVYFTKQQNYFYVQHQDSIMNQAFSLRKMDRLQSDALLEKLVLEHFPGLKNQLYSRLFADYSNVFMQIHERKFLKEKKVLWRQIKLARKQAHFSELENKKVKLGILSSYCGMRLYQRIFQQFAMRK